MSGSPLALRELVEVDGVSDVEEHLLWVLQSKAVGDLQLGDAGEVVVCVVQDEAVVAGDGCHHQVLVQPVRVVAQIFQTATKLVPLRVLTPHISD